MVFPIANIKNRKRGRETFFSHNYIFDVEAVIRRCPVKKLFLNISQNPQGNACTEVFFW